MKRNHEELITDLLIANNAFLRTVVENQAIILSQLKNTELISITLEIEDRMSKNEKLIKEKISIDSSSFLLFPKIS